MIYPGTITNVSDNSGARKILSIKTLKGKNQKRLASTGDIIVGVVKRINKNEKIKNGSIYYCLIIRHKKKYRFSDGQQNSFSSSSVIILNKTYTPIATRIFGPLSGVLRKKGYSKIMKLGQSNIE